MTEDTSKKPPRKRLSIFNETTPNSIKTLRKSFRDKFGLADPATFLQEMNGESDRAAVILSAAMLDDLLARTIAAAMPFDAIVDDMDYIFRFDGPLGSFSARMEIACYFGIIDDETYQQLDIVREMRNACAHSKHPITFSDSALRNVAMRLFAPLGFTLASFAEHAIRPAFGLEVGYIAGAIANGRTDATATAQAMLEELSRDHGPPDSKPT